MLENINKVEQENIQTKGHVAGHNNNISTTNNYYQGSASSFVEFFNNLYAQFEAEKSRNQKFSNIIDRLQHFKSSVDTKVIGLEKKLELANRESRSNYALKSKEYFFKKLLEYEYYETAQLFYAHILAGIVADFEMYIFPDIGRLSELELNQRIDTFIIKPLEEKLGKNTFYLDKYEILGMMYFLTGNCHINWA